jgi:hypothetical protein
MFGLYQCEMFDRQYWHNVARGGKGPSRDDVNKINADISSFLESTLGGVYTIISAVAAVSPPPASDLQFPLHQDIQYSIFEPEDHLSMIQCWTRISPDQEVGGIDVYPCRENGAECYSDEFARAFVDLDAERSKVLIDKVARLRRVNCGSRQYETIWFDSKCLHETADLHVVHRACPRVAWTVRCVKEGVKVRREILDKVVFERPSQASLTSFLIESFPAYFPRNYGRAFARLVAERIATQHL